MSTVNPENGEPRVPLDFAIAAVLAEPVPVESMRRLLNDAAAWEAPTPLPQGGRQRRVRATVALTRVAVVLLLAAAVLMIPDHRNDSKPVIGSNGKVAHLEPTRLTEGGPRPEPQRFYMPGPMIGTAVADTATVLVTNGPGHPVRLGDTVTHKDVGAGLPADKVRLHVWDWSKSGLSRMIVADKEYQGSTLSPDGKLLLGTAGKALDLTTGKSLDFKGFNVEEGQRLGIKWFSPSGRYVVASIHLRSQREQVRLIPPLYSMRHWWALRVIELRTGKIVDEFPAAGEARPAFTPDESSIVYAGPENEVILRDFGRREATLRFDYQPAVGTRSVAGIAVSPDARFVAVGHYHGEMFLWELKSAKLVLHHKFLRDNGDHDTFFQARILRFSPDGNFVAMASGNRLKVLQTTRGRIVASHYHVSTPVFSHLRCSDDSKRVILVAPASVAEFGTDSGFPPKVTADFLPRIYEWNWTAAEGPSPKVFDTATK